MGSGSIKLYHGTVASSVASIEDGIKLDKGNRYADFGQGFYLTPDYGLAYSTACFRAKIGKNEEPVIIAFDFDEGAMNSLNWKSFFFPNQEWANFVIANRCMNDEIRRNVSHNHDGRFDLVIGPVADGKKKSITVVADDVSKGKRELKSVSENEIYPAAGDGWGSQWSFHTPKSLSCLKWEAVIYCNRKEGTA